MKKIFILIAILGVINLSAKQVLTSDMDTKLLVQKSAEAFGKGDYEKAINVLREYWPLPAAEVDNLIYQTKSQLELLKNRFGKKVGHDFVKTEKIGDSFIKHIYIAKFEHHALRLSYVFYKPENEWKVNSLHWDDKVKLLFQSTSILEIKK